MHTVNEQCDKYTWTNSRSALDVSLVEKCFLKNTPVYTLFTQDFLYQQPLVKVRGPGGLSPLLRFEPPAIVWSPDWIYKVFLCPNNAKLVGCGMGMGVLNGYGVCSNLTSSGEPLPPASHDHFNHCQRLHITVICMNAVIHLFWPSVTVNCTRTPFKTIVCLIVVFIPPPTHHPREGHYALMAVVCLSVCLSVPCLTVSGERKGATS